MPFIFRGRGVFALKSARRDFVEEISNHSSIEMVVV